MSLYNLTQKISLNTLQNNVFLNDMPICDTIIQKGVNYKYSYDDSVDRCLWATYNKNDTDLIKNIPGNRKVDLTNTEIVENENCLFVKYSPHFICDFDDVLSLYGLVCDPATEEILSRIELRDYATGNTIKGVVSGTEAKITGFSKSCDDIICLEYDRIDGDFINGEALTILSTVPSELDFLNDLRRFGADSAQTLFATTISIIPFINASEEDYEIAKCQTFKKFVSYPLGGQIDFDTFSKQERIDIGCNQEVVDQITLKYTPNLIHLFDSNIVCDWDAVSIQLVDVFPYYDMLSGQTIRGWHSNATAEVQSTNIQIKNGIRYIVLNLQNSTSDFFAEEPIEILSLSEKEILDFWETEISTFNVIPNFYNQLRNFLNRPYFTASIPENALCTGLLEQIVDNANQRIKISIDGCLLSEDYYEITTTVMNDYLKTCDDKCSFYPKDFYVYSIQFTADVDIGKEIRIKTDVVPYVVNNGTKEQIEINVPAEYRDRTFYLNDNTYSLEPLEFSIYENSVNSRAFTLDDIITEEVSIEYPMFEKFMKYHFAYSHAIGNGKHFLNNSSDFSSIDCIPKDSLESLAKETLGPLYCEKELYKSRALQKEFVDFWNFNGTEKGIEYIFNIMCWPTPKILSPCNKVFTVSGDDYYCPEYLYGINTFHTISPHDNTLICDWDNVLIDDTLVEADINILESFVGYTINGALSNSSAILEDTSIHIDKNGQSIVVAEISHRIGEFESQDRLEIKGSNKDISFTDEVINALPTDIPNFITNVINFGISTLLRGDILIGFVLDGQRGEFCPFEELSSSHGCQESRIYVDCLDIDGSVVNVITGEGNIPNHGFNNNETISLVKRNNIDEVEKILTGRAIVGSMFSAPCYYESRNSSTNDIVVLNDNCLTDPNAYIISVPMNRKDYIDIYDETSREAGSYVFSEYPITDESKCYSENINADFELLPAL